ncbi:MAG: YheC/YheD family protein [bacterium]
MESGGGDSSQLLFQIRDLITKTIASVQPIMNHAYKCSRPNDEQLELCFEILGFDIMIDENLKPWLIEVNFKYLDQPYA